MLSVWRERIDNGTNTCISTDKPRRSLIAAAGFVTAHALNRRCHGDDRCDSSFVRSVAADDPAARRICCFLISGASCDAKAARTGRPGRARSSIAAGNTHRPTVRKPPRPCALIRSPWLASHPNPNRRTQSEPKHSGRDRPTDRRTK